MRLFEISDAIERVLIDGTDRDTGEVTEEALAALDDLDCNLAEKALNLACYIKGELAESEAVKAEAQKLSKRAKIHANRADRLTDYLSRNVETGTKYHDARATIGWRKSTVVEIDNEDAVPEWLCNEVPVHFVPDKAAIKAAHKAGQETPGARVVERQNIQIK